uniref:reelin domain-containing protein 1 n=1 Tax=Lonchura striata TaxID=40157 RepID=UPI001293B694|nr:reelin domain-containing protein 1 [Lonchura striata domestica]
MEGGRRAHTAVVGWACTTLCLVSYAAAFSQGASLSACSDMMPRHLRVQLHSSNSNYVTVHTNMSFFFPGDKVPVTVRSTRDYMGFMLQARKVSNNEIAGTFIFLPPGSKLLTCFEEGDTVTHSDKSLKRNLSFVWKAPDQPIGDIKFFISIVQSYFVYWAKIESAVVAQGGQNKTLADKKPDAVAPTPLQRAADPHPTDVTTGCLEIYVLRDTGHKVNGGSTESGTILKASLRVTASPSALHVRTHLGDIAATTAWLGDASAAGNLSSASRQMAGRELAPQPEEAGTRGEEDKDEQEAAGNTLPWVTRPAPESAVPGIGEGPGRGTRLLAAQLGILLVCTAALGLLLAAATRCVCAQHCHKRAEVSFSKPEPDILTITGNGKVMRFRKVRDNSFVLVPAECNWVSPSRSAKRTAVV